MKFFAMFVASFVSAALVLPTIGQAQGDSVYEQVTAAAGGSQDLQRQA